MSDEDNQPEEQEIVRLENAQLFIPITLGIGGPQIGTGSIHRSEEGEVWLTGDLPLELFKEEVTNLSIYVGGESFTEVNVEAAVVSVAADWDTRRHELAERVKETNTAEFIKELTDPDRVIRRTLETGLPDGPHLFPKETP